MLSEAKHPGVEILRRFAAQDDSVRRFAAQDDNSC